MPAENQAYEIVKDSVKRTMGSYNQNVVSQVGSVSTAITRKLGGDVQELLQNIPGIKTQLFSISFGSIANQIIGQVTDKKLGLAKRRACGYVPDSTAVVPAQYLMRIQNNNYRVTAVIQEVMSLRVGSSWESLVPVESVPKVVEAFAQVALKKSLATVWTSRRMWRGTTPVALTIVLKFEAVYDAYREVVEPCLRLQQMVLPSAPIDASDRTLLSPPGPSPFKIALGKGKEWSVEGDEISISIGNLLKFESVIVKEATVEYGSRLTVAGHPISASANLTFETYEILTKEKLEAAYVVKPLGS